MALSSDSANVATLQPAALDEEACRQLADSIVVGWKNGQSADTDQVLANHPELTRHKSVVLDLAYEEFCQREERGESLKKSRFCSRFPNFRSSLRRQLEIHQLVQDQRDAMENSVAMAWPELGEQFLDFLILEELGRGAFARVYLAEEGMLGGRRVAVKVSSFGAMEAETMGKLEHPNIVPVHSVQEDMDTDMTAIVMSFLGRATFCDVLDAAGSGDQFPRRAAAILETVKKVNFDPPREDSEPASQLQRGTYLDGVLNLVAQLAEALAHAHKNGILHLDLKPSNVLLTDNGTPMLLDFNLSFDKQIGEVRVGGTLPYMSPEQLQAIASGKQEDVAVDERSDIFSAGVLIHELLTGELPFGEVPEATSTEEIAEKLLDRCQRGPSSLRQSNREVSESISKIVSRCLAFDPDDRIQSAEELGKLLRRELRPLDRFKRWVTNHIAISVFSAVMVLALISAAVVFTATRDSYAVRQYKQAATAFAAGDNEKAMDYLDISLRHDPQAVDAMLLRVRVNIERGDFTAASLELEQVSELPSTEPTLLDFGKEQLQLGEAEYHRANYNTALDHFNLADLCNRDSPSVLIWMARTFDKLSDSQSAVNAMERAVELSPKARNVAFLAYCYSRVGFHGPATNRYHKAIDAGMDSAMLHSNLALSSYLGGWKQEAAAIVPKIIDRDPDLFTAYVLRQMMKIDQAYSDEGVLLDIIGDLKHAIDLKQTPMGKGQLHRDLANLYALAARSDTNCESQAVRHAKLALEFGANKRDFENFAPTWALVSKALTLEELKGDPKLRHHFEMTLFLNPLELNSEAGDSP